MLFDDNDSIMELLATGCSDSSLVIVPIKFSSIGRFFNGINNSKQDAKRKQNLKSIRCQVDGEVKVLLYTKRAVKKGE